MNVQVDEYAMEIKEGSNLTLVALTLMFVFSTCTLLQNYYSVVGFLLLFALTEVTKMLNHGFQIEISNRVIYLALVVCMYIVMLYFKGLTSQIMLFASVLVYIHIWMHEFIYVAEHYNKKTITKFIIINIALLLVSQVCALRVLSEYNYASRDLAGAGDEEMNNIYASEGAAGYGFIYGSIFSTGALFAGIKSEKKVRIKIFYLAAFLFSFYLILSASYSIAIFATIMFILLTATFWLIPNNKWLATAIIIIAFVLLIFNSNSVFELFIGVGNRFNADALVKHMEDLISVSSSGEYSDLSRVSIWMEAINHFLSSPIFGTTWANGHSYILKHLSVFGLCSCAVFAYIGMWFKEMGFYIGKTNRNITIVVFVFITLFNSYASGVTQAFIFFIYPCLMYLFYEPEEEIT